MEPYNIAIYKESTWERLCPNLLEDDDDDDDNDSDGQAQRNASPRSIDAHKLSTTGALIVVAGMVFSGMALWEVRIPARHSWLNYWPGIFAYLFIFCFTSAAVSSYSLLHLFRQRRTRIAVTGFFFSFGVDPSKFHEWSLDITGLWLTQHNCLLFLLFRNDFWIVRSSMIKLWRRL